MRSRVRGVCPKAAHHTKYLLNNLDMMTDESTLTDNNVKTRAGL